MKIEFHRSNSGRSYFEDFLDDLPKTDRAEILAVFKDIEGHGFNAIGCQFRQIDGKLWEIKIKTVGGGWRFFYVTLAPDFIHVLHAYKKTRPESAEARTRSGKKTIERGFKMKKQKGVSLETVLERQLKDKELKILFDERRFYLQVAHLVSDLRARSGMSQVALAKAAGVSQPLIARLEVGDKKRTPSFDMVFKVLKALGYKMEINVTRESKRAA